MARAKISDLIVDKISGEWGDEPENGEGVSVLRTTNFTNDGVLDYESVVQRRIESKIVERKKLQIGDSIIEKSGGGPKQPVGRVVYFESNDGTYLCNNFTAILRPKKGVHPKFFFYSLFQKHLSGATLRHQNKTTGIINLKLERYLEEEIELPSFRQQEKIVNEITQLQGSLQKRRQANALTGQFLQSAFLEMFGDPVKNEKGYKFEKLGKLVNIKMGQSPPGGSYNTLGEGTPLLNGPTEFGIKYPKEKQWTTSPTKLCNSGDILFCVRGATAGRLNWSDKKYCIGRGLASISEATNMPLRFVFVFLDLNYLKFQSIGQGSTFININREQLSDLLIPLAPTKDQKKFAQIVADIETLRNKQRESERYLQELFNSLMQRYFG